MECWRREEYNMLSLSVNNLPALLKLGGIPVPVHDEKIPSRESQLTGVTTAF